MMSTSAMLAGTRNPLTYMILSNLVLFLFLHYFYNIFSWARSISLPSLPPSPVLFPISWPPSPSLGLYSRYTANLHRQRVRSMECGCNRNVLMFPHRSALMSQEEIIHHNLKLNFHQSENHFTSDTCKNPNGLFSVLFTAPSIMQKLFLSAYYNFLRKNTISSSNKQVVQHQTSCSQIAQI